MPAYPEIALEIDPMRKLTEVIKAMLIGEKNALSLDWLGISLRAYMMNKPADVMEAYLKIVPY